MVRPALITSTRQGALAGPGPHPTGQWLILHSTRLDGDPQGRVSVIIEPPRPADLAPLLVAAYGLSDREQAVTVIPAA